MKSLNVLSAFILSLTATLAAGPVLARDTAAPSGTAPSGTAHGGAPKVEPVADMPAGATALPGHIGGRVLAEGTEGGFRRQWPGTYVETRFVGTSALFRVGPGDVSLRISVDGGAPAALVKPKPGIYRVTGLKAGAHTLRVDTASETQAGPSAFGGFYAPAGTKPLPIPARARQIEFIGDSHTVGYGNIADQAAFQQTCTTAEVWDTTDTSQGIAPRLAGRYGADYQVNAISGRGIVRNYNGFAADTLPQAYPYTLFDHAARYDDPAWHPQVIVIALGTNDFTTPLHAGEKWATRDALHADYEATYVDFVKALRAHNPQAYFLLWATDMADGEIAAEVAKVADKLHAVGENRLAFLPMHDIAFSGCHSHPSLADDAKIAKALGDYMDAHPEVWQAK
ncbi:SGNH/GDSL hydrolase family protein [Nitrospirillum viridazoti]|uniref:GDSL-like lipase/acylhydrolase family protein n=1 Tax=Nitrospirillum amazonense TaxID=28077 RepID=A0A560IYL5_9PROT|nr:SGNH/GDSL hydrolase family protein [Nitrospirillum amazonense]TWB64006.1 GDSL-like lipase/acylhydrolase family protein [Nitrospirillum amazonense]